MKIFIASSLESVQAMRKIALWIEQLQHNPMEWDSPEAFIAGEYTLPRIIDISRNIDGAIFIFGEDDKTWYRSTVVNQPRDNVLVEYGLFAGAIGPERALICRYGKSKTPTDLHGIIHIDISEGRDQEARARLKQWLINIQGGIDRFAHSMYSQDFVRIVADNRHALDQEYRERKYCANKIDILGMALSGALTELSTDSENKILSRVLFNNAQVRMMFVTPCSEYIKQRAIEDGDSLEQLTNMLNESIIKAVKVYQRFRDLYESEKNKGAIQPAAVGFLEVRITDFCPHFTIYRTDDMILWGIYTAATRGDHSAVLRVQKTNDALFRQMMSHFEKLWHIGRLDKHTDESYLVKCHSRLSPVLNERLVSQLLGSDWEKKVSS